MLPASRCLQNFESACESCGLIVWGVFKRSDEGLMLSRDPSYVAARAHAAIYWEEGFCVTMLRKACLDPSCLAFVNLGLSLVQVLGGSRDLVSRLIMEIIGATIWGTGVINPRPQTLQARRQCFASMSETKQALPPKKSPKS